VVFTATAAQLLDGEAFNQLVLEEGLKTWEQEGYVYAGKRGKKGWELYRTWSGDWGAISVSTVTTADPAAGALPAEQTVPEGKRWLLVGAYAQLVTSADVANRYPYLRILIDGTNASALIGNGTAQTASGTRPHTWAPGLTFAVASANIGYAHPLPSGGIEIPAGGKVSIQTASLQAADDWTAAQFYYKEAPA